MQNIINTGVVFFFYLSSFHCGGEATATSPRAHLPLFFFLLSCACVFVRDSVCVCVCAPLMLIYALGMTLIDLAALLAKYSFSPNLSLS